MIWVWIGLGVLLVAWLVWRHGGPYRKVFTPAHQVEFARRALDVQQRALERIEEPGDAPPDPDDPRSFRTSRDVLVHYTVTRYDDRYSHHVSLSYSAEYTALAVGHHFGCFLAVLYGWPPRAVQFGVSQNRVFHLVVEHAEEGLQPLLEHRPPPPTEQQVEQLWRTSTELLRDLAPVRMDVSRAPPD